MINSVGSNIVYDMSDVAYHAHGSYGSTTIKTASQRSVKHALTPQTDKECYKFGRSFHLLMQDEDRWRAGTAVAMDRRTKAGKEHAEKMALAGIECFSASDLHDIESMAKSVKAHPAVQRLFPDTCKKEVSYFWEDDKNCIGLKCRPDIINLDIGVIGDWKTCQDASPRAVRKTILSLGYHISAAMYMEGTGTAHFVFVFVEKAAPYACAVYECSADLLEEGYRKYREGVEMLAKNQGKLYDALPGYDTKILEVKL